MTTKTTVDAKPGKHDIFITREFDLPLELLFRAFVEPELVAQVMQTKVLKLESKKHGSYQFETSDPKGNLAFRANGVIHEFEPNRKIIKTFEMENSPFGVQLEIYVFEQLTNATSKLNMHVIYESVGQRDQLLKLPFAFGLNMAHNRLEELMMEFK